MPKVTGGTIAAIVAVLLLTGCSSTEAVGADPSASGTTAPLVAETPSAAPTGDAADAAFLAYVREHLPANTQIPNATDEQLLAAGERACEEIAAGADTLTLSLIDGEHPNGAGSYDDSAAIVVAARANLCD